MGYPVRSNFTKKKENTYEKLCAIILTIVTTKTFTDGTTKEKTTEIYLCFGGFLCGNKWVNFRKKAGVFLPFSAKL